MKKTGKKITEKVIRTVAEVTAESASWFAFYEPKMPAKLVKKEKNNK